MNRPVYLVPGRNYAIAPQKRNPPPISGSFPTPPDTHFVAGWKIVSSQKLPLSATKRALAFRSIVDLPFTHTYAIDAEKVLEVSGVTRLGDLNAKNVVVVDSLRALAHTTPESFFAIDDATEVLGTALQTAATTRQVLWLSSIPESEVPQIKAILGEDIVHQVGLAIHTDEHAPDSVRLHGEPLVPIALSPTTLIQKWANGTTQQQQTLAYLMDGTDTLIMRRKNLHALRRVGADLIERNAVWRFLANPKVIAYLIVLVYSSLRALPVVFVPGFHGKVWVLWTIDIVTAIPYTWGIVEMFAGPNIWRRMMGLVVTIVTFVSPYVYFWYYGRGYPAWVNVFIAAMIVGAILIEYARWLRDRIVRQVIRGSIHEGRPCGRRLHNNQEPA